MVIHEPAPSANPQPQPTQAPTNPVGDAVKGITGIVQDTTDGVGKTVRGLLQ